MSGKNKRILRVVTATAWTSFSCDQQAALQATHTLICKQSDQLIYSYPVVKNQQQQAGFFTIFQDACHASVLGLHHCTNTTPWLHFTPCHSCLTPSQKLRNHDIVIRKAGSRCQPSKSPDASSNPLTPRLGWGVLRKKSIIRPRQGQRLARDALQALANLLESNIRPRR